MRGVLVNGKNVDEGRQKSYTFFHLTAACYLLSLEAKIQYRGNLSHSKLQAIVAFVGACL